MSFKESHSSTGPVSVAWSVSSLIDSLSRCSARYDLRFVLVVWHFSDWVFSFFWGPVSCAEVGLLDEK